MDHTYWLKQTSQPLFPDILWSRPESKAGAGKLLVIGGNSHGFSAPATAYSSAMKAGAGTVRVLLPDAVRKVVKGLLPDADFAPSTPSGSFSKQALASLLDGAGWADCVLIAGDVGRNSETAILLEAFVQKYSGRLTITQDAADYFKETPQTIMDRPDTAIVLSLEQLQKMFINTPTISPITLSMSSPQLAEALHDYTLEHRALIITQHNDMLFVAYAGGVSTTPVVSAAGATTGRARPLSKRIWRVDTAAKVSVFWLQNPSKPLEAATTALNF